ncbi:hypothetical protein EJ05DRAFT_480429 [Pseudovirgaria hyperparasitica]|uniref:Uncharacterized protein n=1 Tax=Pseudovirgaria hyperparasitica TaxID=470096 RepID=A0A6A6VVZ3_9PEZI|nr:uncharacterized protein EJ05DRAFT_480429 [Pseudovirgaria hyperparasitica]KAF2753417.1 hypothetical protein EJ05DRAFT_480429 [Pseudovirgaria hyperparasitica]
MSPHHSSLAGLLHRVTSVLASVGSGNLKAQSFAAQAVAAVLAWILIYAGYWLTFLNQYVLATGRFKFPYPLAATLIQLTVSAALYTTLLAISRLWRPDSSDRYQPLSSWNQHDGAASIGSVLEESRQRHSKGPTPAVIIQRIHSWGKQYIMLALVLCAKLYFSNCSLAYSDAHNYELAEIIAASLLMTYTIAHANDELSSLSITTFLIATMNAFFADIKPNIRLPWEVILSLVFSCLLSAAFPAILIRAYGFHAEPATTWSQRSEDGDLAPALNHVSLTERLRISLELLRNAVLLSLLLVLTLFIVTGEILSVWRNYYFLGDQSFILIMAASGGLTALTICSTLLLVQATSPLFVVFVPVMKILWRLWWYDSKLDGMSHIRVVVGGLAGLWFSGSGSWP